MSQGSIIELVNLDQPSCHIRIFRDKGIEADAKKLGLTHIYTDASLTAGPFFERKGYQKTNAYRVMKRTGE